MLTSERERERERERGERERERLLPVRVKIYQECLTGNTVSIVSNKDLPGMPDGQYS